MTDELRRPPPPGARLVLELDLDEATPSNNVIKAMHYRVYQKERQAWHYRVRRALMGRELPAKAARSYLEIERYCSGGGLDWDNAYGGLKPLLDCLVVPSARNPDGLGLIEDDNPRAMPWPPLVLQFPAPRGQGRTLIRVFEL